MTKKLSSNPKKSSKKPLKTIVKEVVIETKEAIVENSSVNSSDKKKLGASSYKNSKNKKKAEQKKRIEVKKVITKDRQIKNKIKHLQKELARINQINSEDANKKLITEKLSIEIKLSTLEMLSKKFVRKPISDKKINS